MRARGLRFSRSAGLTNPPVALNTAIRSRSFTGRAPLSHDASMFGVTPIWRAASVKFPVIWTQSKSLFMSAIRRAYRQIESLSMPDEYDKWRRRLPPKNERFPPSEFPESGLWRMKREGQWVAVQIWTVTDKYGEVLPKATIKGVADARPRSVVCSSVWPKCFESPVTKQNYTMFVETGEWADDVPTAAVPVESKADAIEELCRVDGLLAAFLESIGGEVKTQAQADKAANIASLYVDAERAATRQWKLAVEPARAEVERIDTQWRTVVSRAKASYADVKDSVITPYVKAETIKADASGGPRPKIGTASAKRMTVKPRYTGEVDDPRAFITWLLTLNDIDEHLIKACKPIANRMANGIREGTRTVVPPGMRVIKGDKLW